MCVDNGPINGITVVALLVVHVFLGTRVIILCLLLSLIVTAALFLLGALYQSVSLITRMCPDAMCMYDTIAMLSNLLRC